LQGDIIRSKLRSYDTLNTLYHEAREEMELLGKQLLARYERIYMTVGDNEPVVLGPSMSLLESLCKEICKHKQKKSELEVKATRQAEVKKKDILKLTAELKEKEQELGRVRSEPGNEKDQQIETLRSALQEKERAEATRAVLCTSLAEEADQLRGQLGATVKVCKELLARESITDASEVIQQLQQENQQLKQRVAYVQSLNSQWQKYDSSREDYIRGLCLRLKESSGQAAAPPGLGSASSAMLHQEIARLNGLLEDKIGECVRLSREAEDKKRKDRERMQMLEQQVLIYMEDFKSERADRERAQGQIQDMKEQIRQLKQQLHKQVSSFTFKLKAMRSKDTEHLSPMWSESGEPSELRCPRCQARFSDTEAARYFEHWEECAKL
uniref:TNFAIP3-interacting protein 2 n=1 Tax=Neogobius melanostomus TaxID=47308 RepID=A0A8C6UE01_9GOBI